jgi:hypothetical protein
MLSTFGWGTGGIRHYTCINSNLTEYVAHKLLGLQAFVSIDQVSLRQLQLRILLTRACSSWFDMFVELFEHVHINSGFEVQCIFYHFE